MLEEGAHHTIASSEASSHIGSGAIIESILGFHLNPLIALVFVISLILITPWGLRKIKGRMPSLLNQKLKQDKVLNLQDVLILDNKRRLLAIKVQSPNGDYATALLLTGGPTDMCVGWLGADGSHIEPVNGKMRNGEENTHDL